MSDIDEHPSDPRLEPGFLASEGIDEATVEAVGKLSEALETVEVARGHLYAFHQLSGHADFQVGDAVKLFRDAGHDEFADLVERELVGRNVLPGRWTFQVIEDYAASYYEPFQRIAAESRDLTRGHHHLYEAGLKRERRTPGEPGHRAAPPPSDQVERDG